MEKIYEKDQFDDYDYKRKSNLNLSVISSFLMSFLGIFALIICGFNEVSYAAPESIDEKISFHYYKRGGEDVYILAKSDAGDSIQTPLFFADTEYSKRLFCVEHNVQPSNEGAELSLINSDPSKGSNADPGIAYIINNSFMRSKNMLPDSNPDAEAFATQIAIWAYLANKYPDNPKYSFTESQLNALVNATKLEYYTVSAFEDCYTSSKSIYKTYIEPVVINALSANFTQQVIITNNIGISIEKVHELIREGKVEDGKYYQTSKLSVSGNPDSELASFDLELKGVEGAFAVRASDGTKIENLTSIPKGTDFHVRVPVDKVSDTLQELQIEVKGHFNTFLTNDYRESDNQMVISIDDATRIFVKGTGYNLVGTPDTGMTPAQTIYFIGLIVLLCGVGIVYANAKPIENN